MLSHTAADVENRFSMEVREHRKQYWRFYAIVEIDFAVPAASEAVKKQVVIIDVLP